MRLSKQIAITVMVPVLLVGCSTAPINLNLQPFVVSKASAKQKAKLIRAVSITDQRDFKNSVGTTGNRTVKVHNVLSWVKSTLLTANRWSCRRATYTTPLLLKVDLRKFYVDSSQPNLNAVIVLKVNYWRSHKLLRSKFYRGQSEMINWAGSAGEINHQFSKAMQSILRQVHSDACQIVAK